ncbi:MAG: restriction endonuclease subunit S [Solirubrobacteraceae bacterium]
MNEWREAVLGDVLTLQRGFDLPARDRVDGPYPIVSSSGVTGRHAVAKVEPPGVVIGRYGSLGSVHWVTEPYWPLNTALWVKDFKGNDPRFLSYLLRTLTLDGSSASAVPGVNRNHLHRLPVRVPTLVEQRRISAVLAAFDELIETNERRVDLLEGLAGSLYREWFILFLFPGHDGTAACDSLPDGWTLKRVGDVAEINRSTLRATDLPDPIRYLDISSISPRRIEDAQLLAADEAPGRARRQVSDGDTVWAMVRPNRRSHAIVHSPPANLIASTGLAVLSPIAVPGSFLFEFCSTRAFTDYLVGRATGSAYPAVRPDDFREASIAVPPRELLSAFDAIVDPALRLTSQLMEANRALDRLRDLLLARLVTGRLDISDVDLGTLLHEEDVR